MKNQSLAIATLATLLATGGALAATSSGSLTLTGVVPIAVNITVTGSGSYNSLDLSATQTNLVVATVREQSNDLAGYTVTATSANAGTLKNGSNSVTYTARYNSVGFTLSTTPQTVTTVASQVAIADVTKNLDISYTGTPFYNLLEGTYTDTLTLTVTSN